MKRSWKIIIGLAVILLGGMGVVLGVAEHDNRDEKILIVATNFPAYDFARAVAGEMAEVKILVKPGVETHDFEPTPSDMIEIEKSDLFVYNGGESENWATKILDDVSARETKVFRMMDVVEVVEEEVTEGMEEASENGEPEEDEHVWTSVRNAAKIIEGIRDELMRISPENEKAFRENARKYSEKLAKLDEDFTEVVRDGSRKVLVFGDRFPLRYFVEDYELDYFAAFPGCSEQTEASSKTIAFLVEKIKEEKIPVVLKIEMSSGEIAETIAKETGAKVLTFNTAHNISAEDFQKGRTYIEIIEDNLETLREALK